MTNRGAMAAAENLLNQALGDHQVGRLDEAQAAYEQVLALAADALTNLATCHMQRGKLDEGLALIERSLAVRPGQLNALGNKAMALMAAGRFEAASAVCLQILAARPEDADALSMLGDALFQLDRPGEALDAYDRSLVLSFDILALNGRGAALSALHRFDEAAETFDQAMALSPDNARSAHHRAELNLRMGRLADGWKGYEARWKGPLAAWNARLPRPVWRGETPVRGLTILLLAEQGLGDSLQMVRYAPLLAAQGARVVLGAPAALAEICRSVPGVAEVVVDGQPLPAFDACCPMMSLPLAFGTTLETIPAQVPYLRAPPDKARIWKARLGASSKKRVGLVWSSGHRPDSPEQWAVNARRNIDLPKLRPLARADVAFYSLQKGKPAEGEVGRLKAKGWGGPEIVDLANELHDFADTAAVMEALDLIITVDTSTAHLAGALSKPVWILTGYDACWRWMLERDDSPWYPTARLFRQKAFNDWDPVIEDVVAALQAFA